LYSGTTAGLPEELPPEDELDELLDDELLDDVDEELELDDEDELELEELELEELPPLQQINWSQAVSTASPLVPA
jgi:hypothetical protein